MPAVGPIETSPGQADVCDAARAASALKANSAATDAVKPILAKEIEDIGAPQSHMSGGPRRDGATTCAARLQFPYR